MKKLLSISVVTLVLAGCVATPTPYAPTITEVSYPNIGVVATASVGDKMLAQGRIAEKAP